MYINNTFSSSAFRKMYIYIYIYAGNTGIGYRSCHCKSVKQIIGRIWCLYSIRNMFLNLYILFISQPALYIGANKFLSDETLTREHCSRCLRLAYLLLFKELSWRNGYKQNNTGEPTSVLFKQVGTHGFKSFSRWKPVTIGLRQRHTSLKQRR